MKKLEIWPNSLIDGKADIIFCAKPSEDQIKKAEEKGLTFNMTPIGKEAFVFFVNKRNPISNLEAEQIRGIYSGRIINWSLLGGKNLPIKVYQRPQNSGSQTMLESISDFFYAITANTQNQNVSKFIDWILSAQGQYLVEKTGYVPVFRP